MTRKFSQHSFAKLAHNMAYKFCSFYKQSTPTCWSST